MGGTEDDCQLAGHESKKKMSIFVDADILQQLRVLTERLERLRIQCRAIRSYSRGEWIPIRAPTVEETDSVGILLASMRMSIAELELKIANEIPTVSRTRKRSYDFKGTCKMAKGDGNLIRADVKRLPRSELYKKWCVDVTINKYGYPGGKGVYTKRQVIGAISNSVGGHLAG